MTKEERLEALADEFETENIQVVAEDPLEVYLPDEELELWLLNKEEAIDIAKREIKDDIKDYGLDAFDFKVKQWAIDNALKEEELIKPIEKEIRRIFAEEYSDEDILYMIIDNSFIDEEDVFDEDGDILLSDEEYEELLEKVIQKELDAAKSDPVAYCNYILDTDEDFLKDLLNGDHALDYIDFDKLADKLIEWNGPAYFIAQNGNYYKLANDLVAYEI